jgi:hypothetical protein
MRRSLRLTVPLLAWLVATPARAQEPAATRTVDEFRRSVAQTMARTALQVRVRWTTAAPSADAAKTANHYALLRELREFNPSTPLRHSLENQLTGALSAYQRANAAATCGKLRAFTQHIGSAAGRRLAHNQQLHGDASALMLAVGCSAKSEP